MLASSPFQSTPRRLPKLKAIASLLVTAIIFAAALWTLFHQIREYSIGEIIQGLSSIPITQLIGACALTVAGFVLLVFYDSVALRALERPLPFHRVAQATFVSAVVSANLGFHLFTSAPLRFRFYAAYGLTLSEVAKVIVLNTVTFWMGYGLLGGLFFLALQSYLPASVPVSSELLHGLGIILLGAVAGGGGGTGGAAGVEGGVALGGIGTR